MNDERLKKARDEARDSRAMNDRPVTENRELTDQERLDMFRRSFFNDALPNLPEMAGYHVCWLTTTDPRDTIQSRLRYGYELVTPDMIPGWEVATLKSGEHAGYVGVNEMIAARLPIRLYQMYMLENHYNKPNAEQQKLADVAERIREQAKRKGADVHVESGIESLRKTERKPTFA